MVAFDLAGGRGIEEAAYRGQPLIVGDFRYVDGGLDADRLYLQAFEGTQKDAVIGADVDDEFGAGEVAGEALEVAHQGGVDRGEIVVVLEHPLARHEGAELHVLAVAAEQDREREEVLGGELRRGRILVGEGLAAEVEKLPQVVASAHRLHFIVEALEAQIA